MPNVINARWKKQQVTKLDMLHNMKAKKWVVYILDYSPLYS